MVRAILAGTKTQTRRLVAGPVEYLGGRGEEHDLANWGWAFDGKHQHGYMVLARGLDERHQHGRISIPCPYGQPGDRLWVRETWCRWYGGVLGGERGMECAEPRNTVGIGYLADGARKRVLRGEVHEDRACARCGGCLELERFRLCAPCVEAENEERQGSLFPA